MSFCFTGTCIRTYTLLYIYLSIYIPFFIHIHIHIHLSLSTFPFHLPPFPPSLHFSNPLLSPFSLLPPPFSPATKVTKRTQRNEKKINEKKINKKQSNEKQINETEEHRERDLARYVCIYISSSRCYSNYNRPYFHILILIYLSQLGPLFRFDTKQTDELFYT